MLSGFNTHGGIDNFSNIDQSAFFFFEGLESRRFAFKEDATTKLNVRSQKFLERKKIFVMTRFMELIQIF